MAQIHEALSLLEKNAELATATTTWGHIGMPSVLAPDLEQSDQPSRLESELQTLRLSSLVAARCRKENIDFAERVRTAEERRAQRLLVDECFTFTTDTHTLVLFRPACHGAWFTVFVKRCSCKTRYTAMPRVPFHGDEQGRSYIQVLVSPHACT